MKKNSMANAQAEVGAMESAMEFTMAQMQKAFGNVLNETRKFKQALRVFDGMGALEVPISKSKTAKFADILASIGVDYKGGRINAESVKNAWAVSTEDGYMAVYKNVIGYESGVAENEKPRKVYTWSEEKSEYIGVAVLKKVAVEKWTAQLILRGLLQTAFVEKFEKKSEESIKAWNEFDGELVVFDKVQNKNGVNNKAKKIRKTQVEF